jgi:hypothetical protein
MDRSFRKRTGEGPGTSPPSEAWLFAQAMLGKLTPDQATVDQRALAVREQLEWQAAISTEHDAQLRTIQRAETEARREREQLEWLASISTEHDAKLRALLRDEADARHAQQRLEGFVEGSSVQEQTWDPDKHPRGGYPQNHGWWSPADGSDGPQTTLTGVQKTGQETKGGDRSVEVTTRVKVERKDQIKKDALFPNLNPSKREVVNGQTTPKNPVVTFTLARVNRGGKSVYVLDTVKVSVPIVVELRKKYDSAAQEKFARNAEQDHVADYEDWAAGTGKELADKEAAKLREHDFATPEQAQKVIKKELEGALFKSLKAEEKATRDFWDKGLHDFSNKRNRGSDPPNGRAHWKK